MRELNEIEKEIIQKRRLRRGTLVPDIKYIKYIPLFPRTTLCCLSKTHDPLLSEVTVGCAMRSKKDKENKEAGELLSFSRALNLCKSEQPVVLDIPDMFLIAE